MQVHTKGKLQNKIERKLFIHCYRFERNSVDIVSSMAFVSVILSTGHLCDTSLLLFAFHFIRMGKFIEAVACNTAAAQYECCTHFNSFELRQLVVWVVKLRSSWNNRNPINSIYFIENPILLDKFSSPKDVACIIMIMFGYMVVSLCYFYLNSTPYGDTCKCLCIITFFLSVCIYVCNWRISLFGALTLSQI